MRNIVFCVTNLCAFRQILSGFIISIFLIMSSTSVFAARKSAAMAIDAHSGKILYSHNIDKPHHPASLTKIMTLYMLFEFLQAGRLKLNSKLIITQNAYNQAPSKLGLKPGSTIRVEDAIKILVTKSANDVAVAVAENLGGSEWKFSQLMTWKARKMGMNKTQFVNASGLPNKKQVTTARDMITLAMRIQKDFPQYYPYFAMRKFTYKGKTYKNHNRLMSRMGGIDGIKTGYTRASGFNLTSSIWKGRRHVVAVVMGGKTARRRDNFMKKVLNKSIRKAKNGVSKKQFVAANFKRNVPPKRVARVKPVERPARKTPPKRVAVAPAPTLDEQRMALGAKLPAAKRQVTGKDDQQLKQDNGNKILTRLGGQKVTPANDPEVVSGVKLAVSKDQDATVALKQKADAARSEVAPEGPYHIQIGAFGSEEDAQRRLHSITSSAGVLLKGHQSFTMLVPQNNVYRARFAGFSEQEARKTCKLLKRKSIDCLAVSANR